MKKIKHCVLYSTKFGRNDGPPLYYLNQLRKLPNTDVFHLIPEGDIRRFGKMNYWWWVDWGEDGLPVDHAWEIPKDGGKKIYIASDTHLGKEYRFKKAKNFNFVFFNQKRALGEYQKENKFSFIPYVNNGIVFENIYRNIEIRQAVGWLPHAAEPEAYHPFEILKRWDVCFIGHVQTEKNYNGFTRVDALDRLFKEFPNFYYGTRSPLEEGKNLFEDAAKKYCQAKIVFNVSIKDDLNMRVQEVLATKSFLLTNWIPTLEEVYKDGVHLVTYKTLDEMVEKAKYYLTHDKEREKIALAGYKECIAKHTYQERVKKVLEVIGLPIK